MFTYWLKREDRFLSNLLNVPCVLDRVCAPKRASWEFVCGLGVWPCSTLETHKSVCVSWVQLTWCSECCSKQTSPSAYSSQSPQRMFRRKRESTRQKNMHVRKEKSRFFLNWQLMCCAFQRKRESQRMCVREFARHPSLAARWYVPVCTDTSENVVEQPAVPIKILTGPG